MVATSALKSLLFGINKPKFSPKTNPVTLMKYGRDNLADDTVCGMSKRRKDRKHERCFPSKVAPFPVTYRREKTLKIQVGV